MRTTVTAFALCMSLLMVCGQVLASPLHEAAAKGDNAAVTKLLGSGYDVNMKDDGGRPPLFWAAYTGKTDTARLLLEKGADVNTKADNGLTPLDAAVAKDQVDLVRLMLEKGAGVNAKDSLGLTLLGRAVFAGKTDMVQLLLEKGADPTIRDRAGSTPLEVAERLSGNELLEVAKTRRYARIAQILREAERSRLARREERNDGEAERLNNAVKKLKEVLQKMKAIELYNQATKLMEQGRYTEAIPLAKESLSIREELYGKEGPFVVTTLNALADLYQAHGDYTEAELLYKRAMAILRKAYGEEHRDFARSLSGLADLYLARGDYSQSEALYKRSLAVKEKLLGKEDPDVAASLNDLGTFYFILGDYSNAGDFYKQALAIFEKKEEDPFVGVALNNLATVYYASSDYSQAGSLLKRAMAIFRKFHDEDHPVVTATLVSLAALHLKGGKPEEAFKIFKEQDHPEGLGLYWLAKKEYQQAEQQFQRALTINKERGDPQFIIADYIGLGLAAEGQGNYRRAKESFAQAIERLERQWRSLTLSARQHFLEGKVGAGFARLEPYEGMVRVLLKEKKPGYAQEALRYAERVKSRTFLELLAGRGVKGRRTLDQQLLTQDRQHQQQLTELTQRIAVLQGLGAKAPQGEEKRLQQELELRQTEYERFLNEVKLKDLELASLIGAEAIAIEKLQSLLDPDTTLLEYYTAKDTLYAWLVKRDAIQVHEIALPANTLDQEVNNLLLPNISTRPRAAAPKITLPTGGGHTQESSSQERERNRTQFTQKTEALYRQLLAPLTKGLTTKQLLIVPHGVLHKLPFAALGDSQGLLIERHSLSVLPALSVLQYIAQKRNPDQGRLLALANPVLDYVPGYPELLAADAEVDRVSRHFKDKKVYRGRNATEGLLRRTSATADVIHLAVHGEFNDRQPLQSGLLLGKDAHYDGPLQVHELFDLDLEGVNLVVASACETALSRIQGGDDLVGLSRGFIYAGTPSLLATLWKVDDASTAQLMERFYKNWREQGMSKADALRQAQQALRAMPAYRHPYYWAPFILIGDWQ